LEEINRQAETRLEQELKKLEWEKFAQVNAFELLVNNVKREIALSIKVA
jgi:predicted DNA binding CopG/RHH family protein